jgi:hypothetical protein
MKKNFCFKYIKINCIKLVFTLKQFLTNKPIFTKTLSSANFISSFNQVSLVLNDK